MKKSVDNVDDNVQLNVKQTKQLPESLSHRSRSKNDREKSSPTQNKFKETQSEFIQPEVLRLCYKNPMDDSKMNVRSSKPAKTFNSGTSPSSKPVSRNVKTFLQQHSQQLQDLVSEGDVLRDVVNKPHTPKVNDFSFSYPVEKIELSPKEKTIESSSLSGNLFSDLNFLEPQRKSYGTGEKLYRVLPVKPVSEQEGIRDFNPDLKKIGKRKSQAVKARKPLKAKLSIGKVKPPADNKKSESLTKLTDSNILQKKDVSLEEDLTTKQSLFDFFFFIIFLTIISFVAFFMVSSSMFYFTNTSISMFFDNIGFSTYFLTVLPPLLNNTDNRQHRLHKIKTLRETKTIDEFWIFARTTLLDVLYWSFFNDESSSYEDPDHLSETVHENRILGVARFRQLRVKSDSCEIHPNVQRFFNSCYYYYTVFTEDTDPIKKNMEDSHTPTAWRYTEAKKLNTSYYWGEISVYGGGGYYLDLARNKLDAKTMIEELESNSWISRATRALFISFNIYNANANLFCICRIVLEFPPVGGIIPTADFHTLKIIRYLRRIDFFILGLEIIFSIFVLYYTFRLFRTLRSQKWSFFFFFWNYMDITIIVLSYLYLFLNIVRYVYSKNIISVLNNRYDQYTEFDHLKNIQIFFNNVIAVLVFFCWIKLFQFLDFNTILLEFRMTLAKSLIDILGFFPMFLTMFLAFAFLAYLLFGNQVKTYKTLWLSFMTLLQAFLGEFYYADIVRSSRILGPLFYVTYIFFIFFVLLNVFIAIINDAYANIKSQVYYDKPLTGEYIKRGFVNFFTCGHEHKSKKLRLRKAKKRILFREIELALRKAGFNSTEINIFFYKYNINYSNFLEEDTRSRLMKDLELKRVDFSETSEQVQINALRGRIDSLSRKLEDMEMHLQPILDKVDHIINRLKKS